MIVSIRIIASLVCAVISAELIAATGSPLKSTDTVSDVVSNLNSTILEEINQYRSIHDSPTLVWNENLANSAYAIAKRAGGDKHTRDTAWDRSMIIDGRKGVNVADYLVLSPILIRQWYMDCRNYHVANHTGGTTFTKLIWNDTTDVGCSWSPQPDEAVDFDQKSKVSTFVCLFSPLGNDDGPNATDAYNRNVKFPEKCPTDH